MFEKGFCIEEGVFSADECDGILSALANSNGSRSRAGVRNLMSSPIIAAVAYDDRLIGLTERISRSRLVPFKATLFEKTGKANWLVSWHQDTALPLERYTSSKEWGPSSVKQGINFVHAPTWALAKIIALRIQLDPSTADNGPLRVVAGSHRKRLQMDVEFARVLADGKEVVCMTGRGGVIAMSPLILHASSKADNDEPRRVLHIEYAESLDLAPGIRLSVA